MEKISLKLIKKISSKNFDMKNKYQEYRVFQNKVNPILSKKYHDIKVDNTTLRIFNNYNSNKCIIYIHGGGWVTGNIDSYTNVCSYLNKKTNRMVISIEYRLAPEYKFPTGLNDCINAIEEIYNSIEFNIDKSDIILMGDSAGANIVAAISQMKHHFKISKQILLYPALQNDYSLTSKYKSVLTNGEKYYLTRNMISDYMDLYIRSYQDLNNNLVAPLLKKTLFFQPNTLIITADLCPLRDEGYHYYKRLRRYFNKATYYNVSGVIHGYFSNILYIKKINETYKIINKFIGDKNGQEK